MLGEINYGCVPLVIPLGKQIADFLVAFGFGHRIIKHKHLRFIGVSIFGAIK